MKAIALSKTQSALLPLLLAVLLSFMMQSVAAQSNSNHVLVSVGALYERGFDATLSYEHETKYHNSWEYFMNYYIKYDEDPVAGHITKESFWNNYRTWLVGAAYKPCVNRGRNHHGNVRFGGSIGSDTDDIIGGIHLGYEHTWTLYRGWELFLQAREDFVIRGEDNFRTGVAIGFKIPLQ